LQRRGDADRSVVHGIPHQRLHLIELGGGGLDVRIPKHQAANLGCSNIAGEINADAIFLETGKILAQGAPVGRDLQVSIAGCFRGNDGII